MNGIELSKRFFYEAALPLLRAGFPELVDRIAAGLVAGGFDSGCGSEVGGFDDDISRDHNWGPRFFLFMSEQDKADFSEAVGAHLNEHLPRTFLGFRSTATTLPPSSAYIQTPRENLRAVLGLEGPPHSDDEWITIPETLLFEYTSGPVYYEPQPLVSPVREPFRYYPDEVWYKRLSYAFFMLHLIGNVNRAAQRGDPVTTQTYVNWFLQMAMRTCFLLRRRYAPYCKWLFRAFQNLPDIPDSLPQAIASVASHIELHSIVDRLYEIADAVGTIANEIGVIDPVPLRKKSPFVWTDFNCYGFMQAFHDKLQGPLGQTDPYEHGPLDLQVANGALNRATMRAAWGNRKHR